MNTDLFNHYQSLPTSELLAITRQPDDYTPEAVATAHQILNQRVVTTADEPPPQADKIDVLAPLKAKAGQLRFHSAEGFRPEQWLPVFLIIYAFQLIWSYAVVWHEIFWFIKKGSLALVWILPTELLPAFVFYLLYKRRAWGWILVFALSILGLLSTIVNSYYSVKLFGISQGGNLPYAIVNSLINVTIIVYLWRQNVAALFGIQPKIKLRTALVTCGLVLAQWIVVRLF